MPHTDATHVENIEFISSSEVKAAYLYLVRTAERIEGYRCYPGKHGELARDFQYHDISGWPYAFTVERECLMFHFRKPDQSPYAPPAAFASQLETDVNGDVEVRITTLEKAQQLMREIFNLSEKSDIKNAA